MHNEAGGLESGPRISDLDEHMHGGLEFGILESLESGILESTSNVSIHRFGI